MPLPRASPARGRAGSRGSGRVASSPCTAGWRDLAPGGRSAAIRRASARLSGYAFSAGRSRDTSAIRPARITRLASSVTVGLLLRPEHRRVQDGRAAAPVQQRRAAAGRARRGFRRALRLDDETVGAQHLAAEVPQVRRRAPDRRVDAAQVGEGERLARRSWPPGWCTPAWTGPVPARRRGSARGRRPAAAASGPPSLPGPRSSTGHHRAAAASPPARGSGRPGASATWATDTTRIRGSRPGSE